MESSRDTDKLQSENRGGDLSYTATTLGRRGEKNARNHEWVFVRIRYSGGVHGK